MNYTDRHQYACYDSPHFSLTFRTDDASFAFLGLDSGGRRPDHKNSYNLLKPSFGAHTLGFARRGESAKVTHGADGISAKTAVGSYGFVPEDDRAFRLDFAAARGQTLPAALYEASLSVVTAPPTIWADTDPVAKPYAPKHPKNPRFVAERTWKLPMYIHFPDYGTLRIEAAEGELECRETLIRSGEMTGLSLGYQNHGGHNDVVALHHGISRLVFRRPRGAAPAKKASLRITAEPEISPKAPFLADSRWDGFRRAWLNNFPLNRPTLTMGDNIYLEGLAHLSVHNKADMLALCDPADHPLFGRIRETFVKTLDAAFAHCQAADGEIGWEYAGHPKPEGQLMVAFIDCTPSNLIGGLVALQWAPDRAKRWLPAMLRAADFLLRLDTDGDGLDEVPFNGNSYAEPWNHRGGRPRNWWDNIAFGHKDAWFNLLVHRAMRLLAPVARAHGRVAEADRIEAFLAKFQENFRRELFNPETGIIAGWRDAKGLLHDYQFTFPTAMAVNEGVLTKTEGRAMLRRLLAYMKDAGFGDNRYGIPGNTKPIPLGVDTFDWAFMGGWPRYENGGCCGMTAWHFLNALYRVGLEKEADGIYFRMLDTFESMPTHSGLFPGYMESCDWRTKDGNNCGYNYLADNYLFLAAGFAHHLGKSPK